MEACCLNCDGIGGILIQLGERIAVSLNADRISLSVGVGAGNSKTVRLVIGDQFDDHFLRVAGENIDGRGFYEVPGNQKIGYGGNGQQQGSNQEYLACLAGVSRFRYFLFQAILS